jgi:hypothetical protein
MELHLLPTPYRISQECSNEICCRLTTVENRVEHGTQYLFTFMDLT